MFLIVCFYLLLYDSYRIRIEGMLIKEEFTNDMEWVRPAIEAVITSAKGTISGQHFHP